MSKRSLLLCSFFLVILCVNPLMAQHSVISDRPGIGDSPFVYQNGAVGVETGVRYLESGSGFYEFPQLLVRAGVGKDLELRFNVGSYQFSDQLSNGQMQSQSFGVKYQLLNKPEQGKYLTLIATVDLPFLNDNVSDWFTRFSVQGRTEGEENWALESNLGYGNSSFSQLDQGVFSFTLTPSYSFNTPENSAVYFGYATDFSISNFDNHFLELGFTILTSQSVQLDINSAKNLFQNGFFVGAGFATAF